MNRKNFVRVLAIALVLAMIAPMAAVFAKSFPDVPPDHWAYDPIDKLSNNNIISGYDDGLYRPDNYVKFLEVMKLVDGVVAPSASERASAKAKYEATVRPYNIENWALDSVYTALNRGIISTSTLDQAQAADLLRPATTKYPDRASIAIFYARALEMKTSNDFSVLKHDDVDEIRAEAKPFLVPLVRAGIFAATGSEGNFSGTRPIRRSEMAKITYLSHEYTKNNPVTPAEPAEKTAEGTVTYKTDVNNLRAVIVDTGATPNPNVAYMVDANTTFTLNGRAATFADVADGQKVKITFVETTGENTNLAKKVELTAQAVKGIGYVNTKGVNTLNINYTENTSVVDTTTATKFATDKSAAFVTDASTVFKTYGTTTTLADIKANDMVEFTAENGVVKEVTVYPAATTVTGTLVGYTRDVFNNRGTVTIKLADGKDYVFYTKGLNIGDSFRGQVVTLNLNYKVASNPAPIEDTFTGVVQGVIIDGNPRIIVKNTLNEERTFNLSDRVKINEDNLNTVGNDYQKLYNKTVRVKTSGGVVTDISVLPAGSTFNFSAEVDSPITESGTIGMMTYKFNVKVYSTGNSAKFPIGKVVEITADTLPALQRGDRVEVRGYLYGDNMEIQSFTKIGK